MRNVSIEFLNELQNRMDFYYHADITFADGSSVELGPDDLVVSGNSIVESAESTAFPLGNAIGKRLTLSIRNNEDQFSEYDFYNATIQLYLHFDLSENTEIINLGKYTVRDPETYGSTITLTAVDDMYKADTDFTGKNFPKTLLSAVLDCCSDCGLTLLTTRFANDDFVIQEAPTGITNRQFLGLCAMIAGGNALTDEYGRLKIVTYDLSAFERNGNYSGGIFDNYSDNEANVDCGGFFEWASGDAIEGGTFNYEEITQHYDGGSLLTGYYASGDRLNGGVFSPWEINPVYSGGTFSEQNNFHVFYKNQSPTIATDDVVITGVKIVSNEVEYIYGTEGYVLTLENQLITGDATEAVRRIGELVVGLQFRPFTLDHVSYPLAEFGDLCYVIDRKNRVYRSIVTDVDFSLKGFTVLKCSADSPIRNSSKYNSNSTVQAVVQARKETKKEISEYDKAVQLMTSILSNSLGMFTTIEKTENGGNIIYQHNKPNLSESNIVWKKTENAFVVSTDGGETWNAGIDADGNAVVNVLSATGINFDWAKGGFLELGGKDNESGYMRVLDDEGNVIVVFSNGGAFFGNGNDSASFCEFEGSKYSFKITAQGIAWCETDSHGTSFQNPNVFDISLNKTSTEDETAEVDAVLRETCGGFRFSRLIGKLGNAISSVILNYTKETNAFLFPEIGSFSFPKKTDFSFSSSSIFKSTTNNGYVTTEDSASISQIITGSKDGTAAKTELSNFKSSGYNGTVTVVRDHLGLDVRYYKLTIENGIITKVESLL